jgi:hypothetical protein
MEDPLLPVVVCATVADVTFNTLVLSVQGPGEAGLGAEGPGGSRQSQAEDGGGGGPKEDELPSVRSLGGHTSVWRLMLGEEQPTRLRLHPAHSQAGARAREAAQGRGGGGRGSRRQGGEGVLGLRSSGRTISTDGVGRVGQAKDLRNELEDVEAELARTHSLLFDTKTELNIGKQVLVSPHARHLPA